MLAINKNCKTMWCIYFLCIEFNYLSSLSIKFNPDSNLMSPVKAFS